MLGPFTSVDVGFKYGAGPWFIRNGYLYSFSGSTVAGGAYERFIMAARIMEDGSLAQAQVVGLQGNTAWGFHSHPTFKNNLVISSGGSGAEPYPHQVFSYEIGHEGSIGAAKRCSDVSPGLYYADPSVQINEHAYQIMTRTGFAGQLWGFKVATDGPQQGALIGLTPFASNITLCPMTSIGNALVVLGGMAGGAVFNGVWSTKVHGLGIGAWRYSGTTPIPLAGSALMVVGRKLLICGGVTSLGPTVISDKVYVASIDGDGSVSGWKQVSALASALYYYHDGIVATRTHVYVCGGRTASHVNSNLVQYAKIVEGV